MRSIWMTRRETAAVYGGTARNEQIRGDAALRMLCDHTGRGVWGRVGWLKEPARLPLRSQGLVISRMPLPLGGRSCGIPAARGLDHSLNKPIRFGGGGKTWPANAAGSDQSIKSW